MTTHYSFPSIEQFRTVIKCVRDRCTFHRVPLPKLSFYGTVKLHGTNASIVVTPDGGYYAQSKNLVITPEADNMGFAKFAHQPAVQAFLTRFATTARGLYFDARDWVEPVKNSTSVVVYGEWCGKGILGGTGISQLDRRFVIFAVQLLIVSPEAESEDSCSLTWPARSIWLMPWDIEEVYADALPDDTIPVYCISKFQTWKLDIDFANPAASQNELVRITAEIEAKCPVAASFGVDGVGEGVVWTCYGISGEPTPIQIDDLVFKVKGEKHSDSKVTTVAEVDIERVNSLKALAETVCTEHRLEKGAAFLQESLHTEDIYHTQNIGSFLKWIGNDILKEEADTITGNGFKSHEVTKAVNELAKAWFFNLINKSAMVATSS
jgi:hypothetical protein